MKNKALIIFLIFFTFFAKSIYAETYRHTLGFEIPIIDSLDVKTNPKNIQKHYFKLSTSFYVDDDVAKCTSAEFITPYHADTIIVYFDGNGQKELIIKNHHSTYLDDTTFYTIWRKKIVKIKCISKNLPTKVYFVRDDFDSSDVITTKLVNNLSSSIKKNLLNHFGIHIRYVDFTSITCDIEISNLSVILLLETIVGVIILLLCAMFHTEYTTKTINVEFYK